MNLFSDITIWIALSAGLATFFAPCTFTALPTFLTLLASKLGDDGSKDTKPLRIKIGQKKLEINFQIIKATLFYVLGFLVVFTLLGLTATAIGSTIRKTQDIVVFGFEIEDVYIKVGGALLIFFGLFMLIGDKFKPLQFLFVDKKIDIKPNKFKDSNFFPFIIGTTNAFAWTPCIGPILGGVLFLAASKGSFIQGGTLLFFYGLGISIPFLLLAVFFEFAKKWVIKLRKFASTLYKISAVLMIILGIAYILGYSDDMFVMFYKLFQSLGYTPA